MSSVLGRSFLYLSSITRTFFPFLSGKPEILKANATCDLCLQSRHAHLSSDVYFLPTNNIICSAYYCDMQTFIRLESLSFGLGIVFRRHAESFQYSFYTNEKCLHYELH